MRIFSQMSVRVTLIELIPSSIGFDEIFFLYKNKETKVENEFKFIIETLNDLMFGSLYIKFVKYKKIIGSIKMQHKVAGVSIRLKNIDCEKSTEHECLIYDISDIESADYFGKSMHECGKIKIKIDFEILNQSFKEEKSNSSISKILNSIFTDELAQSFKSINNITSFLIKGNPFCNIKSIIGMIIIDGVLIKKLINEYCENPQDQKCFIKNCMCGYKPISQSEAKQALRYVDYSLGAYLDSTIWQILIKPKLKIKDVENKKLRCALERIGIPKEKFIKYFEGSSKKIGFIMFIDQNKLIISLRGTLSHSDVMNDLNAAYAPFLHGYAHSGILKLTNNFIETELDYIKETLNFNKISSLLIIGHSLGGGVATLLHIQIMKNNLISGCDIETCTFASPPTLSSEFINDKIKNLTTYNYGNDLVPRLSLGALLDFKYLCLSIANIHKVFSGDDTSLKKIGEIRKYLHESNLHPKLYQPGIIYHVKAENNDNQQKKYGFKVVDADFFSNLIYFKDFPADHVLRRHIDAFKYCIDENDTKIKNGK